MNLDSSVCIDVFRSGLKYFAGGVVSAMVSQDLGVDFKHHPTFPEFIYKQAKIIREIAEKTVEKLEITRMPVRIRWCLVQVLFGDVLLQEVFLRQFPKMVIGVLSPSHTHLVDHTAIKVIRAGISSVGHLLPHADAYPDSKVSNLPIGWWVSNFASRCIVGLIRENQDNRFLNIICSLGFYGVDFLIPHSLYQFDRALIENGKKEKDSETEMINTGIDEIRKRVKVPEYPDEMEMQRDWYRNIGDKVRKIKRQEGTWRSFIPCKIRSVLGVL